MANKTENLTSVIIQLWVGHQCKTATATKQ